MSRTGTSSQAHSRFLKKHRLTPYHRSSAPYDEHIRTGIKNQENLIKTFYKNAAVSIEKERIEIQNNLNQIYTKLSDNQKKDLKTRLERLTQLRNANDLNEIEGMLIEIEKRSDSISLSASHSVQDLEYKKALLLIIAMYKLKDVIIKSAVLYKLRENKNKMPDKEYIEYLNTFFNSFEMQPYFRLLNIRGFYKDTLRGELNDKSYIAYLALYSKFLFEYATILNHKGTDDLKNYLNSREEFIKEHLKAKIDRNYYKKYSASPEHSGGRRSKKSKAPLKAIKELCKANQIKLSRIIDGKRVVYKKSELITKLKRRKIRIPIP